MRALWAAAAVLALSGLCCRAQIVNRLKVDDDTFQRYAWGHMQLYNPDNLALADSLYAVGVERDNYRYKCLALSLEYPVRFSLGEYGRMDDAVSEIKELLAARKDARPFYYSTIHEYCQFLIHIGRASDAMLEARAMERMASREKSALGQMYAHRIVGLIQSYRTNSHLAIQNFMEAASCCKEAHAEQELPILYLLISQEYIKSRDFSPAEEYCVLAEQYEDFFPSLRVKTRITRAYLYEAKKDWNSFWDTYDKLTGDPLYTMQVEKDDRFDLDATYFQSRGLFDEALARADSLGSALGRHGRKHGIYAARGSFKPAYGELSSLMEDKDSIYIKVQNEDLAILDAEMNNAKLRQEAERLKAQNQNTILIGFLVMFAIALVAVQLSQWRLRQNLDEMRRKNNQILATRRAYQKAMDAKESENHYKIQIMKNRTTNVLSSYEDILNL